MLPLSPDGVIALFNSWPPLVMLAVMVALAFGGLLVMFRLFGPAGIYAFIPVAVLGANVQVLKVVEFAFFPDPVALGTVLFASTFLATDILNEFYGSAAARKGVWIGFTTFLLWTLILIATLGFTPISGAQAEAAGVQGAVPVQAHMAALFTPAPALFIAGMAAYLISQLVDVALFARLRRAFSGRALWLRNTGSTALSTLIDNAVFSVLAWIVLAPDPLPWGTVVMTYILGTYILRLAVALLDTPFMYLSRAAVGRKLRGNAGHGQAFA